MGGIWNGKSYLTDSLCSELLRASRTPVTTGIKCVVNPLSDYWDQCDFQPVLCVDDMWSVETSTTLDKQLNMLFQVHSPIVLSPPKEFKRNEILQKSSKNI